MKVRARLAGVFDDRPLVLEGEVDLKDGATLKTFFKEADKAMGYDRPKHFRQSLKQRVQPTILINGDRADLPTDFGRSLADGDEISILLPMMGG